MTLTNKEKIYWVSDCIKPLNYKLNLTVHDEYYEGEAEIEVQSKENVGKELILNSKGLEILEAYLVGDSKPLAFAHEDEMLLLGAEEDFGSSFKISIKFKRSYEQGALDGFYKSSYKGTKLFTTKFEPNYARKAFPCFDQPNLKATFEISINCDKKYIALSNNEVESKQDKDDSRVLYNFRKTPAMSTYIVAWAVGELDKISTKAGKVSVNLYAHKDEVEWGRYSLGVAAKCLEYFESYFDFKYPLPKMDLLGFPAFAGGAMENWGLIMFRKTSLLFDPQSTTSIYKVQIATTVCHEIAHMWFGNLVTMSWWDDLWLNEGFATWAAAKAMHEMNLEELQGVSIWGFFATRSTEWAMEEDSLPSTHPVAAKVIDPDEIGTIFDAISYGKGASVIRMLEGFLGDKIFQQGLRDYMKTFQYKNTKTQDLWNSLNKFYDGEKTVEQMISPWIEQEGFPLITVTDSGNTIKISQKKFSYFSEKSEEEKKWPVPIEINWCNGIKEKIVFDTSETLVQKQGSLFKLNTDGMGFYRVQYQDSIKDLFMQGNLSLQDKQNLLNDISSLFLKGAVEIDFSIFELVKEENDYVLFSTAILSLLGLRSIFYDSHDKIDETLKSLIEDKLAKITDYNKCSSELNEAFTNSLVLGVATRLKIITFVEDSEINMNDLMKDVHFEYTKSLFASLADSHPEFLKKFYLESSMPATKEFALLGLTQCRKPENFDALVSDLSFVAQQDCIYLFAGLSMNIHMRERAVQFFIENFQQIKNDLIKNKASLLRHCIKAVLSNPVDQKTMKMIDEFSETLKEDKELFVAIKIARNKNKYKQNLRSKTLNK